MINKLDYEGIKCQILKKDYCEIERQNNICINVFCYETGLTYLIYVSNQKFKDSMDLLLTSNENKSHYAYIKDFNRFMWIINHKQNVKLKCGSISFKNYFKKLPVPFKIYVDFECIFKKVECDSIKNNSS